jgi:hypothetical protein
MGTAVTVFAGECIHPVIQKLYGPAHVPLGSEHSEGRRENRMKIK